MQKAPNEIDVHVGSRIRLQRTLIGMSQSSLGEHLGITFQQVQKYEKGTNRVGASRLLNIATILDVPVSFFFDGRPETKAITGGDSSTDISMITGSKDCIQLARAFVGIEDAQVKKEVLALVRSLSSNRSD